VSAPATVRSELLAPAVVTRPGLALALEAAAIALILGVALWLRLAGISHPTDISDEGIRGVQLRLLQAGFRPVSDIYASQGPLSLWLFWPGVALVGPDIVVARMTVAVNSLIVLLGTAWLARARGGPFAGIVAAAVLAVSPVFLDNSRLAFVEVPSIAPTVLSLVLLLVFQRSGQRGWLAASAVLLAIGTLAKPMAAIAGLPALILLLAPSSPRLPADARKAASDLSAARAWRARLTDLVMFALIGASICALVVLAVGPTTLYEQMVAYRIGARAVRGWDLASNARLIADQLQLNGWGVLLASLVGVAGVETRRQIVGLAVAAWMVGGLGALLMYSPLWEKHVTYLMPPLAILAGIGLASVAPLFRLMFPSSRSSVAIPAGSSALWGPRLRCPALAMAGLAVVAAILIVTSAPSVWAADRAILNRRAGDDFQRYSDDLLIVQAATARDDFVVIDDAYQAMLSGRLTPPFLADLSWNRILARALTADQAISETRRFDSKILVLQDDHLGQVQRYLTWADKEYVLVKSYQQRRPARIRRVYAQPGLDLSAARDALRASLAQPTDVTIGPARLLAYELERREIKPGSRVDLTLMFEALQDRPPEHALITRLRDTDGKVTWENEWKVGEGGQELHFWSAGRWQSQTMRLLVDDIEPGTYTVTIALQRPNGGPERVTATSGASAMPSGDEVDLGQVQVVR
jgi:4-amino-4-deoxy-L-arabinose transferase-like glycosyltransferase